MNKQSLISSTLLGLLMFSGLTVKADSVPFRPEIEAIRESEGLNKVVSTYSKKYKNPSASYYIHCIVNTTNGKYLVKLQSANPVRLGPNSDNFDYSQITVLAEVTMTPTDAFVNVTKAKENFGLIGPGCK